jgi:hypothetical protein
VKRNVLNFVFRSLPSEAQATNFGNLACAFSFALFSCPATHQARPFCPKNLILPHLSIESLGAHTNRSVTAAKKKVIASLFGALKSIPGVSGKIDEENAKVVAKLTHELAMKNDEHQMKVIPDKGLTEEEIVAYMQKFVEKERVGWSEGKVSGKVYNGREEITRVRLKRLQPH